MIDVKISTCHLARWQHTLCVINFTALVSSQQIFMEWTNTCMDFGWGCHVSHSYKWFFPLEVKGVDMERIWHPSAQIIPPQGSTFAFLHFSGSRHTPVESPHPTKHTLSRRTLHGPSNGQSHSLHPILRNTRLPCKHCYMGHIWLIWLRSKKWREKKTAEHVALF